MRKNCLARPLSTHLYMFTLPVMYFKQAAVYAVFASGRCPRCPRWTCVAFVTLIDMMDLFARLRGISRPGWPLPSFCILIITELPGVPTRRTCRARQMPEGISQLKAPPTTNSFLTEPTTATTQSSNRFHLRINHSISMHSSCSDQGVIDSAGQFWTWCTTPTLTLTIIKVLSCDSLSRSV